MAADSSEHESSSPLTKVSVKTLRILTETFAPRGPEESVAITGTAIIPKVSESGDGLRSV